MSALDLGRGFMRPFHFFHDLGRMPIELVNAFLAAELDFITIFDDGDGFAHRTEFFPGDRTRGQGIGLGTGGDAAVRSTGCKERNGGGDTEGKSGRAHDVDSKVAVRGEPGFIR